MESTLLGYQISSLVFLNFPQALQILGFICNLNLT